MMKNALVGLAARNTLRRRTRTGLTVGMVALGVALLVVALAWIRGVFGQMIGDATSVAGHVRIVDPEYAEREELNPLYAHLPDVEALAGYLRGRPGVAAAEPRIVAGVTVTATEDIGEVFALAVGGSERYFRERVGARDRLVSGAWFTGAEDELIVGARVAEEAGASVGDELVLLGLTQDGALSPIKGRIVGITRGGTAVMDQQVFVPLERMRWLTDLPDGATELLVYGEAYGAAPALADQLLEVPELAGLTLQPWTVRDPWAGLMETIRGIENFTVFFVVLLTALGIWNTMMMSVLERTAEIGVLRALGLTRLGVVALFVGEAAVIAMAGGLIGAGLGALPAWLLERHGLHLGESVSGNMGAGLAIAETVYADLSIGILGAAFLLGLATAVVGSLLPALRAANIQPVSAMRAGR